jgi:hypothetical protein
VLKKTLTIVNEKLLEGKISKYCQLGQERGEFRRSYEELGEDHGYTV